MREPNGVLAIVTGANRGIGFEICRQLALRGANVILTARDPHRGKAAADRLRGAGLFVVFHVMDVTDGLSIRRLREAIEKSYGRLDVLINNAGIIIQGDGSALETDITRLYKTLDINCCGALRTSQAFLPLLCKSKRGRIINISSGLGSLSEMRGGLAAYRISKACLNALTLILASELGGFSVSVNAVCPGWVRTNMGGAYAPRPVELGADTAVWLALDAPQSLRGTFLRDRQIIPW